MRCLHSKPPPARRSGLPALWHAGPALLLAGLQALTLQAGAAEASAGAATALTGEGAVSARELERQFRSGETRLAMQRLEQALALRPADASLRFLHGVLLSESGRSAEAVPVFEHMTEDFPDLPEPYNNLAVLQAAAGQIDRARGLLETALRLDPGYRAAHENLGDVLVRQAQRAYEAAAASPRAEPLVQTKLRLARELAAVR